MATLQPKIDAVKTAVESISTCTPATVTALKELLTPEAAGTSTVSKTKISAKSAKAPSRAKTKTAGDTCTNKIQLDTRDKTALATHVVNATLRSLAEAAKPQPPATPAKCQPSAKDAQQTSAKRTLRRSISAPLSPLQPRALNRVATSPNVTAKMAKVVSQPSTTRNLATVECARIALSSLRSLRGPVKPDETDFQIEGGMSTLVAKLLSLEMHEHALKELRILKRRLDTVSKSTGTEGDSSPSTVAELLDFHGSIPKPRLAITTSFQIQVLKLILANKRPSHIENAITFLDEACSSSPLNLLTSLAGLSEKDASKAARNMASVSQLLLSLAPKVSSSEDSVAMEPRLSPSPSTAFRLQSLAFQYQMRWWKIARHQGKIDSEVLSPFARCARAYARRETDQASTYTKIAGAFGTIQELWDDQKYSPTTTSSSPLASIYQILGTTAQSSREYAESYHWFIKLKDLYTPEDSFVRSYAVSSRLLAVALRMGEDQKPSHELVNEITDGLDGSLSGTISELNELFESLSMTRRSVVNSLMAHWDQTCGGIVAEETLSLKTFLLRYPRFVRRWLGAQPKKDASPKQSLQFEQRRQTVLQCISQVLDAALMIVKSEIKCATQQWESLDHTIQDCTALLDVVCDPGFSSGRLQQLSTYYIKISSLYFARFQSLRREPEQSKAVKKQVLQSLSRSIDTVKDRSPQEKEKAQLSTKCEIMADLCKTAGRTEDALATLRTICKDMVEEGVLRDVAASLREQTPELTWTTNDRTATLSRTLRSIAKLDESWNEWTFFLPEEERAAVVEHLIHISTKASGPNRLSLRLHHPAMAALLRLYRLERFPIRRARALLYLLAQNLDQADDMARIDALLNESMECINRKELSEDSLLLPYVPHLQAQYSVLTAVGGDGAMPFQGLQAPIASWTNMVRNCRATDDLYKVVDNPQDLLDSLRSVGELLSLRGEACLRLSILELSTSISKLLSDSIEPSVVWNSNLLISQHVSIGRFSDAKRVIGETAIIIESAHELPQWAIAGFHLSQVEYYSGVGNQDEASKHLSKANAICDGDFFMKSGPKDTVSSILSSASYLSSDLALQGGHIQDALCAIKSNVRTLSHDWSKLETSLGQDCSGNKEGVSENNTSQLSHQLTTKQTTGPLFWSLALPFMQSLLLISTVYAHIGMFQETMYYAEYALKVATSTRSSLYIGQASAWIGSLHVKASQPDKAADMFVRAKENLPRDTCSTRALLARQIGDFYRDLGDEETASSFLDMAEETTRGLNVMKTQEMSSLGVETVPKEAAKPRRAAPAPRTTRATKATAIKPQTTARAPKKKVVAKKSPDETVILPPSDLHQSSLLASVTLSRAMGYLLQKDWLSALSALETIKGQPKLTKTLAQEQTITAMTLIGHSMEMMTQDPIFSVLQDSTISYPAVSSVSSVSSASERNPTEPGSSETPPRRGRGAPGNKKGGAKEKGMPGFAEALIRAQELLVEARGSSLFNLDSALVHQVSALLQTTVITLSAAATAKAKEICQPTYGTVAAELARNITWKREHATLHLSKEAAVSSLASKSHRPSAVKSRRSSMDLSSDMVKFHNGYVELLPKSWNVISVALSENRHDLFITKFQAGHSPFILRLPLERANSRDADSEVFNFEQGHSELLDIIKAANETSHSARDFNVRGERTAWWAEREELDTRLKELLVTVESTWLGGFKGIFSQHQRRPELLARFQKSFHKVLDANLPSRSRVRGRNTTKPPSITLDPRILDLFIGLGDPLEPDCDFDEALTDLLYFVVDVLQFHGERNAYDEVDFDAMVVETYDALRAYYSALKADPGPSQNAHTVLVLDKALHAFPWESLPCMEGLAVSRVPSLACLRRLILDSNISSAKGGVEGGTASRRDGHHVSASSGTYILNPSSDLKNTQSFFQPSFDSLQSWTGLVNRAPEEAEFERALTGSDIFLYFGHGSGAQYVRGSTVRRLEKCRPATFLMGCSSAALTAAGDFECYGPVWNHLMAGCPAVVGTLWDVTDRDIDRFAGRAFEEWGLFPRGTFKEQQKKKGKKRAASPEEGDTSGMDEEEEKRAENGSLGSGCLAIAVARARSACRFKYLNAAAVVLYGIPVYIDREEGEAEMQV